MREFAMALAATTASSISRSCAAFSLPKPIVCTGSLRLCSALIVSTSIPPEFSAPSLSSTTAPTGRSLVSAVNCRSPALMCVDPAPGRVPATSPSSCAESFWPAGSSSRVNPPSSRYTRVWNFFCKPASTPSSSAFTAAASRVVLPSAPASAIAMLRESSTSTAMMFCSDFSSATVIAGSHNSSSNSATVAASSPQTAHARQFLTRGAASGSCRQISHANPPAKTTIGSISTHPGHAPRRMSLPFVNTGIGYLKKNSNMPGKFEVLGSRFKVQGSRCKLSIWAEPCLRSNPVPNPCFYPCRSVLRLCLRFSLEPRTLNLVPDSMRHAVHHIVQPHPKRHRRNLLSVRRIVRPHPRIAQVHVGANRHHDPPMIVPDPAPLRHIAVLLIGPPVVNIVLTRHLEAVVQVIQHVEYLVLVGQVRSEE